MPAKEAPRITAAARAATASFLPVNVTVLVALTAASLIFGHVTKAYASGKTDTVSVFQAVVRKASKPAVNLRAVLGFNICLDVVVRAADVPALGSASESGSDHSFLATEADLRDSFSHHFTHGAAGERSCDPTVFADALVTPFLTGALAGKQALGGNAALMARKLARVGGAANMSVMVAGQVGSGAAALLPSSIMRVREELGRDEMHFILEYATGEVIPAAGASPAPRANRFIVTADSSHTSAAAMLEGITAADATGADVLVVAGLHMMEPLPPAARSAIIDDISGALSSRAGKYSVHMELASAADAAYVRLLSEALFPHVDSLGFNEQESAFLYESLGGGYGGNDSPSSRTDVASVTARPNAVARVLRYVMETFPTLTRVHFHALPFHIVAHASSEGRASGKWRDPAGAVAAGAVAAATDACAIAPGDVRADAVHTLAQLEMDITDPRAAADEGQRTYRIDSNFPVAVWKWPLQGGGDITFALAPVAVCIKPQSTVGLGDAISAAGLAADTRKL